MARLSSVSVLTLAATIIACGAEPTPPGTLALNVNPLPTVVTTTTLAVSGQVQRLPTAVDVPILVSVTVGTTVHTDTAEVGGAWAFSVTLSPNSSNTITISASDPTGSTAEPVSVSVRHDNQGPTPMGLTPADRSDGVMPATVTAGFSEAVQPSSVHLTVLLQGAAVPGDVVVAADSLSVTFTPATPFLPNAVHAVVLSGMKDEAGNAGLTSSSCFVTGGSQQSFTDATNDTYYAGSPPGNLSPLDLTEVRLAQTATTLLGIVRFSVAHSLSPGAIAPVLVAFDLDTDNDGGTGYTPTKDVAFNTVLPNSGLGVEYGIWLVPRSTPTDSSFVVQYTAVLDGNFVYQFLPGECGLSVGFAVPRSVLGNEDGTFRTVLYSESFVNDTDGYGDPAPDTGYFDVALPAATALRAIRLAPPIPMPQGLFVPLFHGAAFHR